MWISVDDRLPECYHRVLIYRPDKFVVIAKFVIGCVYHFQGDDGRDVSDGVTHWMPLPQPPQEKNNE